MKVTSVTFKTSVKSPTNVSLKSVGMANVISNLETYKKEVAGELIQASNGDDSNILQCYSSNGFVDSVIYAYNKHHNIVLRPDDVWMAVLTQFSCYVNANAETLRSKFVAHEGQKQLTVKTIGELRTVNYGFLSQQMTEELHKNLVDGDVKEWIIPNFTTTTTNDVMVSSVVMMAAMKSYFKYKFQLCCGIPEVTLLGTVEDWEKLRQRLEKLQTYDIDGHIKEWCDMLIPVFDEFVNASNGNHNDEFWSKVCSHIGGGSGPRFISGWISSFCVFTQKGEWQGNQKDVKLWNESEPISSEWPIIETCDIPPGYVTVPVLVDDNGVEYNTMMFAGSFCMSKVNDTTLRPRLDWALALIDEKALADAIQKNKLKGF